MKAAFIGNRHDIEVHAPVFREAFSKYDNQHIKIYGVLSNNPENTTNLAILLNVKAYINLSDLLKECDILFVCYRDAMLKGFVSMLKSIRVRNKVICFFSPGITTSDLGKGNSNSYYSVSFPYICGKAKDSEYSQIPIMFEKSGPGNSEFEKAINACFENAVFCNKSTYAICYMAQRILSVHMKICMRLSEYLYKKAGIYSQKWFELLTLTSIREEMMHPASNKIKDINLSHFREFCKLMSEDLHSYLSEYIAYEETLLLNESISPQDEDVRKIIKKLRKSKRK